MEVVAIDVPELGNRSYIIHDGTSGIVVDPSRRIQQILTSAKAVSIAIEAVFETHIHNDYITGGYALAQRLKVPYYISDHEEVSFAHEKIAHEQTVVIGQMEITALSSPGHTHHHQSYLVVQKGSGPALFSGGSLLYGAVGRTDLVSAKATLSLAKAQYRSAQFFVDRLDPSTELYPTHGFGSFCAATETEHVAVSTIKQQMKSNSAYTAKDEASFVKDLIKGLDDYPAYYAYMAPLNAKGPLDPPLDSPKSLTKEAVIRALHTGAAIIDMRSRRAYAEKHMPGTYNIELDNSLATYAGWLFAWETPLILVAAKPKEVTQAQEQLSLIGKEIIAGKIAPTDLLKSTKLTSSYPVRNFKDLAKAIKKKDAVILDVRRRSEWQKSHIPQSKHIALHELTSRLDEVRGDKTIWVHCASGFRAAIAASILSGNGQQVVLIDDDYENTLAAGLLPIKKKKYVNDIATGDAQLLDVRENSEWDKVHAQGALHIPLGELLDGNTDDLQAQKPIYIYCASGQRSGMAESFLNSHGFKALNIGGLDAWIRAGGNTESS